MAKVIELNFNMSEKRKLLINAVGDNTQLKQVLHLMSEEQIESVYTATEGTLMDTTTKLNEAAEVFRKFIQTVVEGTGSTMILCAMINYVADLIHDQVPPVQPNGDLLDNAYKYLFNVQIEENLRQIIGKTVNKEE